MSDHQTGNSGKGPIAELTELLWETVDGEPGIDTKRRVSELVLESDAACRLYVQWINLHVELGRSIVAEVDLAEEPVLPDEETPDNARGQGRGGRQGFLTTEYWREHRVRFGALALALTVLFWVGFGWLVVSRFGGIGGNSANTVASIAQITDMRNVAWAEGATAYKVQDSLHAEDTLDLISGHVQLRFQNGAVLLLQGPAQFVIDTRNSGTLELGRLVARVENGSQMKEEVPFAIYTELAQIIDRGTEFGVSVDEGGSTQVEVFEGLVEATPQGAASDRHSRPLRLAAGACVRIEPGGSQFEPDVPSMYVRDLPAEEAEGLGLAASDWLQIRTLPIGDGSNLSVYAVHAPRENYTLISFDVSRHFGAKAAGPGTLTLTVQGGKGTSDAGSFELELRQLNQHNAGVDLATASEDLLDEQSGKAWRNNAGEALPDLKSANSVLEITSSLIASRTGPFAGDSPTRAPAPGTQIVLTIPRATLQSWLDQTAPAIVVVAVGPPQSAPMPRVDFYHFGDGTSQPLPTLKFDVVEPKATD